jgi:hypothetical protein
MEKNEWDIRKKAAIVVPLLFLHASLLEQIGHGDSAGALVPHHFAHFVPRRCMRIRPLAPLLFVLAFAFDEEL